MKKKIYSAWIQLAKRWWKQLICKHADIGIQSYPFRHEHGKSHRFGIWQRKVCLQCGKILEDGHAWKTGLSESKMKLLMQRLGHEAKAFSIKRAMERR
uniref:hypothetical protein n=1 Tax=Alistipes sp. TaxID=1872444 RepID=UPI00405666C5